MKLTKETEYALEGLASLAKRPEGTVIAAADLADTVGTSVGFMSKILQRLSGANVTRGRLAVIGAARRRRIARGRQHFRALYLLVGTVLGGELLSVARRVEARASASASAVFRADHARSRAQEAKERLNAVREPSFCENRVGRVGRCVRLGCVDGV